MLVTLEYSKSAAARTRSVKCIKMPRPSLSLQPFVTLIKDPPHELVWRSLSTDALSPDLSAMQRASSCTIKQTQLPELSLAGWADARSSSYSLTQLVLLFHCIWWTHFKTIILRWNIYDIHILSYRLNTLLRDAYVCIWLFLYFS